MGDIFRDLVKLNLISQLWIAQERFSSAVKFKDFVFYYFSRFTKNLTHAFSDFSSSEIIDFNSRHREKIDLLTKHPSLQLEGVIVPVPRGMRYSYLMTLKQLLAALDEIHPATVKRDLTALLRVMGTDKLKDLVVDDCSKETFETAKNEIGKLFSKTGLTHSTAPFALGSKTDIKSVNTQLLEVTGKYYPDLLSLNTILKAIEDRHNETTWTAKDKETMASYLMTMAYRLSILAAVMDHVQSIEHGFVGSLDILLKKIS